MRKKIKPGIEKEIKEEIKEVVDDIEAKAEKFNEKLARITGKISSFHNEKTLIGIILVLIFLLAVFSLFPNLFSFSSQGKIKVEIVKIEGCEECFDLSLISSIIKGINNVEVKKEKTLKFDSAEAEKLIKKYEIKKIPALILLGKTGKIELDESVFRKDKSFAVFDKPVPYLDLASGKIFGLVSLKEIYEPTCKECASFSRMKEQLEAAKIKVKDYELLSITGAGKELAEGIANLPSLLISKNIEEYWWFFPNIENSLVKHGNYYRFSQQLFPYKEISTGKIKGKVELTYITNETCDDCFNVTQLKSAFQEIGVYIESEKYVDVKSDEGKNLLLNYKITAIPTVVLSDEISDYEAIKDILEKVGSFENKEFVFRKLEVLEGKYQNLA